MHPVCLGRSDLIMYCQQKQTLGSWWEVLEQGAENANVRRVRILGLSFGRKECMYQIFEWQGFWGAPWGLWCRTLVFVTSWEELRPQEGISEPPLYTLLSHLWNGNKVSCLLLRVATATKRAIKWRDLSQLPMRMSVMWSQDVFSGVTEISLNPHKALKSLCPLHWRRNSLKGKKKKKHCQDHAVVSNRAGMRFQVWSPKHSGTIGPVIFHFSPKQLPAPFSGCCSSWGLQALFESL